LQERPFHLEGLWMRPLLAPRTYVQVTAATNENRSINREDAPVADYNVKLSQFHQRVWQDELEAPATIDEYGWVQFGPTSLGELSIILREYNPEGLKLEVLFFNDKTSSHDNLLRICNRVNAQEDAQLFVSDNYNIVRASIYLLLAEPGEMPDEGLLRAVIGPAISKIKAAMDEFASELKKLDSERIAQSIPVSVGGWQDCK